MRKIEEVLRRCLKDKVFFARVFFGVTLGRKQAEALNLGGQVQVKVCGRRFGKTLITLIDATHACFAKPGAQWYIVAPSIDQAKIYLDEIESRKDAGLLGAFIKDYVRSPFPEIKFKNNSVLRVRSTARDGVFLRGKGADGVVVTEAAFVKDRVYYDVIRAMVLDRRGRILIETTPNGHNYVYELFQRGLSDATHYYRAFHATVYDNERLDPVELERIRQEVPELTWRVEYLAEFLDDETFLFPWSVLQHVFEDYEVPGKPLPGHRYVMGVDLAKYQDYTVILVLDVTEVPYTVADFHRYRGRLYADVVDHINSLQARYRCPVHLDATGVGEPVAEQVRGCVPFVFTARSKEELLGTLALAIQRREVLLPSSLTALRDELRYFQRVAGRLTAPEGHHDDCVMSLALAVHSVKSAKAESIVVSGLRRQTARILRGY